MEFLGELVEVAPQAASGASLGPVLDHFTNVLAGRAQAGSISSHSLARLAKASRPGAPSSLRPSQRRARRYNTAGAQVTGALHSFLGRALPLPGAAREAEHDEGTTQAAPLFSMRCSQPAGLASAGARAPTFCRRVRCAKPPPAPSASYTCLLCT